MQSDFNSLLFFEDSFAVQLRLKTRRIRKEKRIHIAICIRYARIQIINAYMVCMYICEHDFWRRVGHTFNFAGPIMKSDMHHSEINSQQQRAAHVLFVMSPSDPFERVVVVMVVVMVMV